MRIRLVVILTLGAILISAATAIGISNIQNLDRSFFLMENVQNEVNLVKQSASLLTSKYSDQLVHIASEISTENGVSSRGQSKLFESSPFRMVSVLSPGDGGWLVSWMQRKGTRNVGWREGSEKEMVKTLPLAAVKGRRAIWYRHLSDSGHALFVVMVRVKSSAEIGWNESSGDDAGEMIVAGVLTNQAFASAIESFKGTDREAVILDDRGYALGYTKQQYVGAPLTNHSIVEKLLAERKLTDSGEFKNTQGQKVIGAYARLEDSNLYTLVARPVEGLPSLISTTYSQLATFSFAGLIFCVALMFLMFRSQIASFEYLQDFVISLAQGLPIRAPENYTQMPVVLKESVFKLRDGEAPLVTQRDTAPMSDMDSEEDDDETLGPAEARGEVTATDKTDVTESGQTTSSKEDYEKAVKGLVGNFKKPLGAIIGQTQLARSKSNDAGLKQHYVVIEREARKLRETLEGLLESSGKDDAYEFTRVNLAEVALSVLSELRPKMDEAGVQLRKDLKPSLELNADSRHLKAALKEILLNAIESMASSQVKELFVASKDSGAHAQLVIQDSGRGISTTELSKVFDPFYSSKSSEAHKGLGLSMVKNVIESHEGTVAVESAEQKGTRLLLNLPLRNFQGAGEEASVSSEDTAQDWENLPPVEGEGLLGQKPITGTAADELPAAPEDQEVTWVGRDPDLDLLGSPETEEPKDTIRSDTMSFMTDVMLEADADNLEDISLADDSISDKNFQFDATEEQVQTEEEDNDDFPVVAIRKPKVGEGS